MEQPIHAEIDWEVEKTQYCEELCQMVEELRARGKTDAEALLEAKTAFEEEQWHRFEAMNTEPLEAAIDGTQAVERREDFPVEVLVHMEHELSGVRRDLMELAVEHADARQPEGDSFTVLPVDIEAAYSVLVKG